MKTDIRMLKKTFRRIIAYSLITAMFLTQFSGMNIVIVQAAEQTESQTMSDSNISNEAATEASTKAVETETVQETMAETQQKPEDSESDKTAETSTAAESVEPISPAETEPRKNPRGVGPQADISAYFDIVDYRVMNRQEVETTEFEAGDQMKVFLAVKTKDGVEFNFSAGDTIVIPLPILPHFEFGGSGSLLGDVFTYEVVGDTLVFKATESGASADIDFYADLLLNGTAKKDGNGIDAGGRPGDYPGGLTINPAPEPPPVYVDNDIEFPDQSKDFIKKGKQWSNGGNVINWSGQVNYRGLSDLFDGTSSNRSNSLIVDHLEPGTKFKENSLYVTVPCFVGNNAGKMGERQIGYAKLDNGSGTMVDQPTNFTDPIIHDYRTTGFVLLEQGNMTYQQFLDAVQDYPSNNGGTRAYGVYTHADDTQTVLIAFGDLPGNTHYYDELYKNFVPPYNDIDIFEAIKLDKSLSQEQRNQLYDIYSRRGPSGGAITAYNFGFDVDVEVPEYGSGIYENEMDYLSDEKNETADAEVDFSAQWGNSSAGFLQLKKKVYGSGSLETPRNFEFQIKDEQDNVVAYGKTNQQVTEKGQEVAISFYKKCVNGVYSEPIENIDKNDPNHWSKILTADEWYYIEEIDSDGYDVSIVLSRTDEESNRFKYKPGLEQRWSFMVVNREATVKVEGTKTWVDGNNQDGIRPDSITVELYADNVRIETKTVTAAEQWKYSFENLPKFNQSGQEIVYRIDEVAVNGYDKTVNGYNLTNTHPPELTSLKVVKSWVDDNDRDGKRPDDISVDLLADGNAMAGKRQTLNDGNSWSYTWSGLPKKKNGIDIVYSAQEIGVPSGYVVTTDTSVPGTVTITNTYETEKISISGTKTWNDENNQDGKRPSSITVIVYADNVEVARKQVTAADDWKYSFINLPKYKESGTLINYTVGEEVVAGYTPIVTGTNIANNYTPEQTTLTVKKVWTDSENQDGKRPADITVDLLAGNTVVAGKRITLNEGNNWTYTWSGLPKKSNGTDIVYSARESGVPSGYVTTTDDTSTPGTVTITNTYTPEKTRVFGTKTWEDANDQDGKRPASITVKLYADNAEVSSKTVSATDNWQYSFENLPKYRTGGIRINYTVDEVAVPGYSKEVVGTNIINRYTPEETTLSVTKIWNDSGNQDGKRPASVTVDLLADGAVVPGKRITLDNTNSWSDTWTGLPKKANKTDIVYSAAEVGVPSGYTMTTDTTSTPGTVKITNSYTPEKISFSGRKIWDDNNDQDGKRPTSITVKLYADNVEIDSKEVTATDNWQYTFTNLPKYRNNGTLIVYTVDETAITDYSKNVSGNNITNRYTPEETTLTVSKVWSDFNNQDGKRPASITVDLTADGSVVAGKRVTLDDSNNWSHTWTGLPKKDSGTDIVYSARENGVPSGYTSVSNNATAGTVTITNSYTPEKTAVFGTKTWDDANNQDGKRPASITVILYADDTEYDRKQVTAAGNWQYSFTDLPKYRDGGTLIVYRVDEVPVPEYTTEVSGTNIINRYTPEETSLKVIKAWDDSNNQDNKRPANISVDLLADGTAVANKRVTLNKGNNWTYTWSGLPKKANGSDIVYTAEESGLPSGYTVTTDDTVSGEFTITNHYTPEKISVAGAKTWEDAGNQDGKRPDSITVNLYADDVKITSKEVKAADNWQYSFNDLPKYRDEGALIVYRVDEEPVDGYTSVISGSNITNRYTPEKISVTGTKTWSDAGDQDGKRPASITVRLFADNVDIQSKQVTAADNWQYSFTNLPKYRDEGIEIVYTIDEDPVPGYTKTQTGNNLTNTYTPEQTTLTVRKIWDDSSNQDGKRPINITVDLLADNQVVAGKQITLDNSNNWTYTWSGLAKKKNGTDIVYSAQESGVPGGYTVTADDSTPGTVVITNSRPTETVNVTGTKAWDDDDDRDGKRPSSITVNLYADNVKIQSLVIDKDDNWQYAFTNLPKYRDEGTLIVYTVDEDSVNDYSKEISGYNITNRYTPEETTLTVTKVWNDDNDRDGKRPQSITVDLLADGSPVSGKRVTLNNGNNWSHTWTELPKKKNGSEITYSARENAVPGDYTSVKDETTPGTVTITNTYTPEKISISGTKTWDDSNNQDGKRPASITVKLYADNAEVGSKEVTAADNWQYSFTDLPKYKDNGTLIVYTVDEEAVAGYTKEVSGSNIINRYTPEETTLTVSKIWQDAGNQDGKRPASITVDLTADGNIVAGKRVTLDSSNSWSHTWTGLPKKSGGAEIVYGARENGLPSGYTAVTDSNTPGTVIITNRYTPEETAVLGNKSWEDFNNQDGKRPASITVNLYADNVKVDQKQVTAASNWQYSFTGLPKYRDNGTLIVYTVDEEAVPGYTKEVNGYNITNRYTPEETTLTVNKVWNDSNNQDNKRPANIAVDLIADGNVVANKRVTLNIANNWSYTWSGLPKKENGTDIVYSARESGVPSGYTVTTDEITTPGTVTITNSYTPETTSVSGTKTWEDASNQDGVRPTEIVVNLYADDVKVDTKTVTAADNWQYNFTGLQKYRDQGVLIVYRIDEEPVTNYTKEINGTNLINRYTPKKVNIAGTKTWDDSNNQDGIRPAAITVNLYADGTKIDSKEVKADSNWQYSFTGLPKYRDEGTEIVYTIDEESVAGYDKDISGTNITNSYTPEETTLSVTKVWNDSGNQDGKRPANITVDLLADNNIVAGKQITLSNANNWTYTWSGLPKKKNGTDIVYSAKENGVPSGYTVATDDTTTPGTVTITNSYTTETTSVSGTKTWDDAGNQDGKRPASITVILYADNVEVDRKTVTATDNWQYAFTNLQKYRDQGTEIVYTVGEESITDYTKEIDGSNIINHYTPEETSLTVTKVWSDSNNQDGKRPASITADLLVGGIVVPGKRVTLNSANNWSHTWTGLPKKAGGIELIYSASENEVPGDYTSTKDVTTRGTVTITNAYTPETTTISGTKSWDDANNQDGKRPASITVRLYADNVEVASKTVTAADNWQYQFTGLAKYRDAGTLIAYRVDEDAVTDYSKEITGTNIANRYTPEETTLTVTKVWDDSNNQDGKRPNGIVVDLLGDGSAVAGKRVTLDSGNNWTYTWTGLPKKAQATDIVYSAEEVGTPSGYTVTTDDTTTPGTVKITNSYTPETISIAGTKTWDDNNNQDGKRPTSIVVKLYADNAEVASKTVTATDNWQYQFTGMPKYRDAGTLIAYRVDEESVTDYSKEITGMDITNRYTPESTTLTVSKVWDDSNNQDGNRPASITVDLLADGAVVSGKRITLSSANNWTYTWTGLPKKENAVDIVYSAEEVGTPNGYTVTTDDTTVPGTVMITNSYTPETTTVSGTKSWDDANDQDGKRPASITVKLYADNIEIDSKTVTAADNWEYTFTGLPKYRDAGTLIAYRVDEEAITDYSKEVTGYDITNRYTPEETTLTVSKVWADSNNQDGNRPAAISVDLLADGNVVSGKRISLNSANNWTYTWTALPKKENAADIFYSARESGLPSGYTVTTDDTTTPGDVVITNSYTPEKISVTGTKIWDDSNDQDGKRPDQITVKLYADNVEIDSKTVTAAENWEYEFDNLPKYRDEGIEIAYRVDEDAVDEYSKEVNGHNITNRYTPEETTLTVAKIWDDNDNQDGKRPVKISVALYADGTEVPGKTVVINERSSWTYTWTDLPKFNNGVEIVYSAKEVDVPAGYTEVIDDTTTPGTVTITNSHTPEVIEVSGTKSWDDDKNKAGKRPEEIVVELFADGRKVTSKEVTAADQWKYSFTDLPKYEGGAEIIYHIDELAIEDYRKEVNRHDITNHYEPKLFNLSLKKVDPLGNGLSGAEFILTDSDGNESAVVPDAGGIHQFALIEGAYTLKETKAPEGYEKLKTVISFSVDATGKIQLTGETSKFVSVGAEGLELRVINQKYTDGNYQDPTEPDTETESETKNSSNYYNSYRNNNTVVNRYGNTTVRTGGSNPKTGDDTEIIMYVILLSGAGALIIAACFARKRKRNK